MEEALNIVPRASPEISIKEPLSVDTSETDTVSIDGDRHRYILGSNSSSASSPAKISSGNTTPTSKPSPPITPTPASEESMVSASSNVSKAAAESRIQTATPTTRHSRPNRPGITWRVNGKLEALDFQKKWYTARIVDIDDTDRAVLIHFDGWNQRYDEWIDMKSDRLRPFPRHSDRKKEAARLKAQLQEHKLGDNVFAKWTDCRMYAGTIVGVNNNGSYEVLFYDGFKKSVQPINVKTMSMAVQKEYAVAGILPDPTKRIRQKIHTLQKDASFKGKRPNDQNPHLNCGKPRTDNREDDEPRLGPSQATAESESVPSTSAPSSHSEVTSKLKRTIKRKSLEIADEPEKKSPTSTINQAITKSKILLGVNFQVKRLKGRTGKPVVFKNRDRKKELKFIQRDVKNVFRRSDEQRKKQSQFLKNSQRMGHSVRKDDPNRPKIKNTAKKVVPATAEGCQSSDEEVVLAQISRHKDTSGAETWDSQQSQGSMGTEAKNAFKVEEEHNKCKCPFDNCNKSFRKTSLVEYHIKYYHTEDGRILQPPPPVKRRRKTLSVCSSDSEMSTSGRGHHIVPASKRHRDTSNTSLELPSDSSRLSALEDVMLHDLSEVETLHTTTTEELDSRDARGLGDDPGGLGDDLLDTATADDIEMDRLNKDEVVNCICQINEENGLMIQCDVCLCWQHAMCMELTEEGLPSKYVCYVCANPPGVRDQGRYIYDQDWLKQGTMARFGFLPQDRFMAQKAQIMQATHSLVADVHNIQSALHSTKCQIDALKEQDHPEVRFWVKNWDKFNEEQKRQESKPKDLPKVKQEALCGVHVHSEVKSESTELPPAIKTEIKTETDSSNLDNIDGNNSTQEPDPGSVVGDSQQSAEIKFFLPANESSSSLSSLRSLGSEEGLLASTSATASVSTIKDTEPAAVTTLDVEDPTVSCEQRLLQHVSLTQEKVDLQLELLEDQITALESADDNGSNHSSGDVLRDVPRIKKAIHQILNDLVKVKHMSLYH